MWYFTWTLGTGFAIALALLVALWGENKESRLDSLRNTNKKH